MFIFSCARSSKEDKYGRKHCLCRTVQTEQAPRAENGPPRGAPLQLAHQPHAERYIGTLYIKSWPTPTAILLSQPSPWTRGRPLRPQAPSAASRNEPQAVSTARARFRHSARCRTACRSRVCQPYHLHRQYLKVQAFPLQRWLRGVKST